MRKKIHLKRYIELLYKEKLPYKDVAEYFDVSVRGLISFRNRHKLPPRGWSKHPMRGKHHSKKTKEQISKKLKGMLIGPKNGRWCGNRRINTQGYVLIRKPNHPFCDHGGFVREHRLVMEKKLNRILKRSENVHHINGIVSDNRIENLVVCSNSKHHKYFHKDISIQNLSKSPSHIKNMKAK